MERTYNPPPEAGKNRSLNMKKNTLLFSLGWFLSICLNGQGLTTANPEEVGLSSERLQQIAKVIDQHIEDSRISGAVSMVARKGKLIWYESHGMMDTELGKPMERNALFQLASMTKPITATAVMMLYEQGQFLLSDPISKYIPEFSNPMVMAAGSTEDSIILVPAKSEITIRDVLNFTCGVKGKGQATVILSDNVRAMAGLPLVSHPGEEFNYGLAYDILAYLVEIISGKSFDAFLREEIFIPLKMFDTHFVLPSGKTGRLARMYALDDNGKILESALKYSHLLTRTYFSGGTGLMSTGPDYMRFAQMILNGGVLDGVRLLSPKSVELMTSNSIGDLYSAFRHWSGDKYGLGFGIRTERGTYDELESVGTVGWDGAYYTRFFIDPDEELIGIFLSQCTGCWRQDHDLITKFRVAVFQSIIE